MWHGVGDRPHVAWCGGPPTCGMVWGTAHMWHDVGDRPHVAWCGGPPTCGMVWGTAHMWHGVGDRPHVAWCGGPPGWSVGKEFALTAADPGLNTAFPVGPVPGRAI